MRKMRIVLNLPKSHPSAREVLWLIHKLAPFRLASEFIVAMALIGKELFPIESPVVIDRAGPGDQEDLNQSESFQLLVLENSPDCQLFIDEFELVPKSPGVRPKLLRQRVETALYNFRIILSNCGGDINAALDKIRQVYGASACQHANTYYSYLTSQSNQKVTRDVAQPVAKIDVLANESTRNANNEVVQEEHVVEKKNVPDWRKKFGHMASSAKTSS